MLNSRMWFAIALSALSTALSTAGCTLGGYFEYGGEGAGAGGSATGGAGTGAMSSAGGQGGEAGSIGVGGDGGGGLPCGGVNLDNNTLNCGECGFDCHGDPCVDGRCEQVIDVGGGDLRALLVVDKVVYFSQYAHPGPPSEPPRIRSLPIDFASDTVPSFVHQVGSAVGTLVLGSKGTRNVYYAAQGTTVIQACNAGGCKEADLANSVSQISYVMAPAGDRLYFGDFAGGRLLSLALDGEGVPISGDPLGSALTVEVQSHATPFANDGVSEVRFLPPDRLYWAGLTEGANVDGCVYTALIADLIAAPLNDFACWSPTFAAAGFTVDPVGNVYGQVGWFATSAPIPYVVKKFAAGSGAESPFVGEVGVDEGKADFPRATDGAFLYVKDATSTAIKLYPLDGGARLDGPTPAAAPEGIDASRDDYVFYTAGSKLHRWSKPRK